MTGYAKMFVDTYAARSVNISFEPIGGWRRYDTSSPKHRARLKLLFINGDASVVNGPNPAIDTNFDAELS